jgi:hypothetical protein
MPSDPGTPTLDQLKVLLTVVDVGSFGSQCGPLSPGSRLDADHPENGGPYSTPIHTPAPHHSFRRMIAVQAASSERARSCISSPTN